MDGEGKFQLEKQFTKILQCYSSHLTLLITWSSWSQNIFQLQKTNSSLNTPLCPTALISIESIQCLLDPIYFPAFSFITNIISTITTITLSHTFTNIYHLLLFMCPEFHFGSQYYYNIPIPQWEKWNLQLYFQRWGTEKCLVTNGRNMSALWAMLQITSAPSVKPLKNSPEHFPLGEITSKLYFYSVCTFGSY